MKAPHWALSYEELTARFGEVCNLLQDDFVACSLTGESYPSPEGQPLEAERQAILQEMDRQEQELAAQLDTFAQCQGKLHSIGESLAWAVIAATMAALVVLIISMLGSQ